jgi:transcriptional regulator with XRE-family HTH domain
MTTKRPRELLREARVARGRTVKQMAQALSMDPATYNRIELGKRRYLVDDAIAASTYLRVPISRIVTGRRAEQQAA